MLVFLMPADVRRNLMLPPGVITAGEFLGPYGSVPVETGRPPKTHRRWAGMRSGRSGRRQVACSDSALLTPRSRDGKTRRVGLSGPVASLVVAVPRVTRRVTG